MLTTGASLGEIALSCGMSDQSHFTRSFRRIVGESPSSWRQTRHGTIEEQVTELAFAGITEPILILQEAHSSLPTKPQPARSRTL